MVDKRIPNLHKGSLAAHSRHSSRLIISRDKIIDSGSSGRNTRSQSTTAAAIAEGLDTAERSSTRVVGHEA